MKFKVFGCGGCGINVVNRYSMEGFFRDQIGLLGLDTSDANTSDISNLKIELVPGAVGSGSDQSKNAERYGPFLQKIITQYEPGSVNILVYSASGGSGSSMGPTLHRMLLERQLPVISVVVGDMSTITEATNTVGTLLNLNMHTETNNPVIFSYFENNNTNTHGKINSDIIGFIDSLRLMLGPDNKRVDQTDIYHLFFYNRVVKAAPVLSCLDIVSGEEAEVYSRKAVGAISLYDKEDNITQVFSQLLYRKAGIFGETHAGHGYSSLHAVLDHGDSVSILKTMLANQRRKNAEINDLYQNTGDIPRVDKISSSGTFVKFDI